MIFPSASTTLSIRRMLVLAIVLLLVALSTFSSSAFAFQFTGNNRPLLSSTRITKVAEPKSSPSSSTRQYMSSSNKNDEERFSREVRLREEAESPFRKVRYFLYLNIAGGATTSLLISVARIAAALNGVNTDLFDESIRNAIIDLVGLVGVAYFWRQDTISEESRLKRATKGAELAKLNVRASKSLLLDSLSDDDDLKNKVVSGSNVGTFTTTLASFRRERGIEKRIVIAAAGEDKIQQVLKEAEELQSELSINDLVVVPVVMPKGVAPSLETNENGEIKTMTQPANVALPVTVGNNYWKLLIDDEAAEAIAQGVDIEEEGFCIVLKKNGRVGQRTRGIFLNNLVGNVVARKEAGMDVRNI